jgi:hypothetical protein
MKQLISPLTFLVLQLGYKYGEFLFYGMFYRLEAHKRTLKSGESDMLEILQEKEVALATLEQQCRKLGIQEQQLEGKVERLQDDTASYKELLQVSCVDSILLVIHVCILHFADCEHIYF